jgi:hypothetical protein
MTNQHIYYRLAHTFIMLIVSLALVIAAIIAFILGFFAAFILGLFGRGNAFDTFLNVWDELLK